MLQPRCACVARPCRLLHRRAPLPRRHPAASLSRRVGRTRGWKISTLGWSPLRARARPPCSIPRRRAAAAKRAPAASGSAWSRALRAQLQQQTGRMPPRPRRRRRLAPRTTPAGRRAVAHVRAHDRAPRSPASQHADRVGERGRRGENPSSRRARRQAQTPRRAPKLRKLEERPGCTTGTHSSWNLRAPAARGDHAQALLEFNRKAADENEVESLLWIGYMSRSTSPTTRKVGSSEGPPAARGPRNAR